MKPIGTNDDNLLCFLPTITNDKPRIFISTDLNEFNYYDDVDIMHIELSKINRENIKYDYTVDEGSFLLHFDINKNLIDIEVFDWKKREYPVNIKKIVCVILRSFINRNEVDIMVGDDYGGQKFSL